MRVIACVVVGNCRVWSRAMRVAQEAVNRAIWMVVDVPTVPVTSRDLDHLDSR